MHPALTHSEAVSWFGRAGSQSPFFLRCSLCKGEAIEHDSETTRTAWRTGNVGRRCASVFRLIHESGEATASQRCGDAATAEPAGTITRRVTGTWRVTCFCRVVMTVTGTSSGTLTATCRVTLSVT